MSESNSQAIFWTRKVGSKYRKTKSNLVIGTWNVRTLVESSGDERICRKGPVTPGVVDRKLDLLDGELKRYRVSVAGIQETKWFGSDVWPAGDGFTFLHSGRPLPNDGARAYRNEGVGIALDGKATEWVHRIALEGEAAVKDGRTRWDSIRKLQHAHAGRRPLRSSAVLKEDGEMTQGPEEVMMRWHQHFRKILNEPSLYRDEVIEDMPELPSRLDLDALPTAEELECALSKLKRRKAGGMSGILPELVLYGGVLLWNRLLELMQDVWEEGNVVEDWKNAVVVPIPKKGDLKVCDNWRGISLLDVVAQL